MDIMKCCGISKAVVTSPVIRSDLETPGWRVLDFQGNPLGEGKLEHQRKKIRKRPRVVRDREHPFAEKLITDEAGVLHPQLPDLTKVSCLVDALKMGGGCEMIEKLWAQFVLTAGTVNTEVAWTCDHFISFLIHIVVLLLVNNPSWNATPNCVARGRLGEGSPILPP